MKKRMRTEQKSNVKNSIRRLAFVAISVLIQLVWILEQFIRLNRYSTAISLTAAVRWPCCWCCAFTANSRIRHLKCPGRC